MFSIRKLFFIAALLSSTSTASPLPDRSPGGPPGGPGEGEGCSVVTMVLPDPTTSAAVVATSATTEATSTASIPTSSPTTVARLPSTGSSTDLPSTNNTVKFVAVGRGIQNYTCTGANATPVALGAIAVLFDYTSIATSNETELNTLPGLAVDVPFDPFTPTPTSLAGLPEATVLGHHFFAADATPTFNLTGAPSADGNGNMILFAAKTASVSAPAGAPLGPDGTGAVAWLQLEAKTTVPAEISVGVKEVYRVETAGGNPDLVCLDSNVMTIDYAAEYWFFD